MVRIVHFLDGSHVEISLQPSDTVREAAGITARLAGVKRFEEFVDNLTLFSVVRGEITPQPADPEEIAEKVFDRCRKVVLKFLIMTPKCMATACSGVNKLVYFQARYEVLSGACPCPPESLTTLAALALRNSFGPWDVSVHSQQFVQDRLLELIPIQNLQGQKGSKIAAEILAKYKRSSLDDQNPVARYLELVGQLPCYGLRWFDAQVVEVLGLEKGQRCVFSISRLGVGIFEEGEMDLPLVQYSWAEIKSFGRMKRKNYIFFNIVPPSKTVSVPNQIFGMQRHNSSESHNVLLKVSGSALPQVAYVMEAVLILAKDGISTISTRATSGSKTSLADNHGDREERHKVNSQRDEPESGHARTNSSQRASVHLDVIPRNGSLSDIDGQKRMVSTSSKGSSTVSLDDRRSEGALSQSSHKSIEQMNSSGKRMSGQSQLSQHTSMESFENESERLSHQEDDLKLKQRSSVMSVKSSESRLLDENDADEEDQDEISLGEQEKTQLPSTTENGDREEEERIQKVHEESEKKKDLEIQQREEAEKLEAMRLLEEEEKKKREREEYKRKQDEENARQELLQKEEKKKKEEEIRMEEEKKRQREKLEEEEKRKKELVRKEERAEQERKKKEKEERAEQERKKKEKEEREEQERKRKEKEERDEKERKKKEKEERKKKEREERAEQERKIAEEEERRNRAAVFLQACARGVLQRKRVDELLLAIDVQRLWRGFTARKKYQGIKQIKATEVKDPSMVQGVKFEKAQMKTLSEHVGTPTERGIILFQAVVRGVLERLEFIESERNIAALYIQAIFRGFRARANYSRRSKNKSSTSSTSSVSEYGLGPPPGLDPPRLPPAPEVPPPPLVPPPGLYLDRRKSSMELERKPRVHSSDHMFLHPPEASSWKRSSAEFGHPFPPPPPNLPPPAVPPKEKFRPNPPNCPPPNFRGESFRSSFDDRGETDSIPSPPSSPPPDTPKEFNLPQPPASPPPDEDVNDDEDLELAV